MVGEGQEGREAGEGRGWEAGESRREGVGRGSELMGEGKGIVNP